MPRKKEEINFMSLPEIVDYAIKTYPCIELQTRDTVRKYIERKLIQHRLYPDPDKSKEKSNEENPEKADNDKGSSEINEENPEKTDDDKKVSEIIAKLFVHGVVYPHFNDIIVNPTKKTKKIFERMDEELRYNNHQSFLDYMNDITSAGEPPCNAASEDSHPDGGLNHIPKVCYDNYTREFEDAVVRGVKEAFFGECYDFNEEEFRRDLEKRSKMINENDPWLTSYGYEELTWKLEHPIGNYIFPKKS